MEAAGMLVGPCRSSARDIPSFVTCYKRYHDHVERMKDRANLALRALQQADRPRGPAAHDPSRR
jgi:hypothetical protein